MLATALSGSAISDVCEIITREGVRWHHLDIRPVTDPVTGHLGVMLNEIDVTDRVEAEQARVAAEQKTSMAEARRTIPTTLGTADSPTASWSTGYPSCGSSPPGCGSRAPGSCRPVLKAPVAEP